MLKTAWHPTYAHPLPQGHRFPMLKYELIPQQLLHEGVIEQANLFTPKLVDEEAILYCHDVAYWQQLRDLKLTDKEQRRIGFPLNEVLVEREMRIAQGTIDACNYAMQYGVAFNVAGGTHHAGPNWGEGFCMLNDQAIAAAVLVNRVGLQSVLVVDLDVHQGNGTARIYEHEPRVFTFSMHGANNFPLRKEQSDLDIALPDGVSDEEYLEILKDTLPRLIAQTKPAFVFYLAGVDVLATDKLGKLALSKEACKLRDRFVFEQCIANQIPVQVSMGGGYSVHIKDIVDAHCNTFKTAINLYF